MPLMFDMPLEKLHHYQGRNPRPADFDEFWDRSLAELKDVEPCIELRPAEFVCSYAECFHMYYTGIGGARIYAKLLRPRGELVKRPALLMFHGYPGNSGEWSDKLPYVAAGYIVAAMDCRGQGGRSQDCGGVTGTTCRGHIIRGLDGPPETLLFRQIFLDTVQLARIVLTMPEVDADCVGATGGSQGGALTLACAALEPRVRRAAAVFPFLCDYQRVWEMDLGKDPYLELQTYFRQFDPLHQREEEVFTKLGYIDVQHLAPRIRASVLMSVGLMDMICPPSSQFAAYNKITSPKQLALYPDFGHETLPGNPDRIFQFLTQADKD